MAYRRSNGEILTQAAILEERFQTMYSELKGMANDKTPDPSCRLHAQELATEVTVSIIKVHTEAPIIAITQLRQSCRI